MADLRRPPSVSKFVDLSQYSQVDAQNFYYQLPRVVNNLLKAIGNNVVLHGLDVTPTLNGNQLSVEISEGALIQDSTLIEVPSRTTLSLPDCNIYDDDGKFVVYVQFQYLQTVGDNPVRFGLQHISQTSVAADGWDHNKNRTVLTFFDFSKNVDGSVASVEESSDEFIEIDTSVGKRAYYKYGLSEANITLVRYIGWHLSHWEGELPSGGTVPPEGGWPTIIEDDFAITDGLEVGGDASFNGDNVFIAHDLEVAENLSIQGIFKAQGERILLQSDDVEIDDRELLINANETAQGITGRFAGLKVNRGSLPPAVLIFDEVDDVWRIGVEGQELTILNWGDTKPSVFKYKSTIPSVLHVIDHRMNTLNMNTTIFVEDPITGVWGNDLVKIEHFDFNTFYVKLTEASNVLVNIQQIK
jgi:hypothetical protein